MLTGLIGELSAGSEELRALWAAHDVEYYRRGVQRSVIWPAGISA